MGYFTNTEPHFALIILPFYYLYGESNLFVIKNRRKNKHIGEI